MAKFDESKHPRDSDGKFTDGQDKTVSAIRKYSSDPARDLEYSHLPSAKRVVDSIPQSAWDSMSAEEMSRALRQELPQKKMTPEEKIASVHIDRTRDNILPELGDIELKSIGATKSKPVLVKKSIIDRNAVRHKEISDMDFETIIATALYDSPEVFKASSSEPYYHFAKFVEYGESGALKMGLCLLDVSESKDCFEVVHVYVVNGDKFEESKKAKNKK